MPDDVRTVVPEVLRLDEDSYEIGLVVTLPDQVTDGLFWGLVLEDALENDWRYQLDDAADADPKLLTAAEGWEEYDEEQVTAWLQQRYEPPRWMWWLRVPDEESDTGGWLLNESTADTPGAIFGALITPRRIEDVDA